MQNQLSCDQVCALLTFLAENKLSTKLTDAVMRHIESCPECMEKLNRLKKNHG